VTSQSSECEFGRVVIPLLASHKSRMESEEYRARFTRVGELSQQDFRAELRYISADRAAQRAMRHSTQNLEAYDYQVR